MRSVTEAVASVASRPHLRTAIAHVYEETRALGVASGSGLSLSLRGLAESVASGSPEREPVALPPDRDSPSVSTGRAALSLGSVKQHPSQGRHSGDTNLVCRLVYLQPDRRQGAPHVRSRQLVGRNPPPHRRARPLETARARLAPSTRAALTRGVAVWRQGDTLGAGRRRALHMRAGRAGSKLYGDCHLRVEASRQAAPTAPRLGGGVAWRGSVGGEVRTAIAARPQWRLGAGV